MLTAFDPGQWQFQNNHTRQEQLMQTVVTLLTQQQTIVSTDMIVVSRLDIAWCGAGANMIPADVFASRATPEWYRSIIDSAVAAHMNMIR